MKFTVVLTAKFPPLARELLAQHFDVIEHPTEHDRSEEDMITLLAEADAAITLLTDPITRRVLEENPNLRCVSNFAVGYNNVDVAAARELGVVVTNTPGVLTEATADLTMGLILATTRRIVEGVELLREEQRCEWDPLSLCGPALQGKRLGIIGRGRMIIGMGRIGTAVATRARAFGMEVAGVRRGDSLDELLASSDIISLHAPLSAETHHLITAATLSRMKRGAYLINTSRGALIDESALCDALDRGQLGGAALDVFEYEPIVNPRLLTMRNVVAVPHIGSATQEARDAMARIAATNVMLFLRGQAPLHRVA
jgi:glyoxylate reductase